MQSAYSRRDRRRRRGSRRCRDAPAPPEGNAKEVTRRRRRVTTAASRDDSVVAHGSLPAACGPWSRRTWPMEPSHTVRGASRLWPTDPSHMAHGSVAHGPWKRRRWPMDSSLMLPSKTHLAALGQVVEGIGQVVVVIRHLLGSGGRRRGAFRDSRAPLGHEKPRGTCLHFTKCTKHTKCIKTEDPPSPLPPPSQNECDRL